MQSIMALFAGFAFALGLGLSGMANPNKVKAFLDLSGKWDPSLLFVMAGGIFVYSIGYFFLSKVEKPIFASQIILPKKAPIDRKLLLGASVFGLGWGLSGYCPGPAITSLGSGSIHSLIFVGTMIIGMIIFAKFESFSASKAGKPLVGKG